ncbi:uncharacterized protein LOC107821710 isoform X3 [Nicotiana tabacum]|uniref:Maf-like protein DDB_G0281937 isoform X3 n=2 Tax=Nicotiana TaxID=4085 RepID=A0A1S4CRB2_TOBAC|nr:PREDICTED: maf-like protein DDB_G0281937 isoform X7 [Nicotiana sylvestris]XP_016503645.1 PREDICTED: maf-like protein DDB_G0281937 isoform X3 [Nicotiana tabacum]
MAPKNLSFKIILGSSSMARRKILADMGYDFTVMTADIDEKSIRKENAEELVVALAEAKADAIMSRLETTDHLEENTHPTLLITADTVCLFLHIAREYFKYHDLFGYILPTSIGIEVAVYQGIIREKPSSKEEARQFIKSYSGGQATVVGSVVVTNLTKGIRKGAWERSEIGTADHVMGLPRSLTEKLIQEAL